MAGGRRTILLFLILFLRDELYGKYDRKRKGTTYKEEEEENLPDHPIQLVRPDPVHHQHLEIVDSNVKYLYHIDSAIAVVAVVGKYHSGKSFLLNQLMRKQRGFGIGPTVRPETMGIWMWGKPMDMRLPSGQPVSVIFIDTEGFAANNISEAYDAKIFSVATLLSSYLIYNSVKIIDQAEIDYLELLARRTQLFALRSQMSRSQWFDEFNHDLLKFPPLVWVIQDFVQLIESGESPREWLHRIMESKTRESAKHDINLKGIFDNIDCHTMFLPATTRSLLQDLSAASEEDLTPEYREERDSLLELLKKGLSPKEKNGKPITGPEFATLLEILVTAANEGSLAEIPGRWEIFLKELKISAVEDCITFYESDMEVLHRRAQKGPINETELKLWHSAAMTKAETLLKQLLFGLDSSTLESTSHLTNVLKEKFEMTLELNDKKIQLKCSEMQHQIEVNNWDKVNLILMLQLKFEEKLRVLELPMDTAKVQKALDDNSAEVLLEYSSEVHYLSENSAYNRHFVVLQDNIKQIADNTMMRNTAAIEKQLKQAVEQAVDKFREASANVNETPRKTDTLRSVLKEATGRAKQVYKSLTVTYAKESVYPIYEGYVETRLQREKERCMNINLELVKSSCESVINDLLRQFQHNTGASKLTLPVNDTELEASMHLFETPKWKDETLFSTWDYVFCDSSSLRLTREKKHILEEFKARMGSYDDTTVFSDMRVVLYMYSNPGLNVAEAKSEAGMLFSQETKDKLEVVCGQRKEENYNAYIREVQTPLDTARKLILLSAERFDTEFSLWNYMVEVCMLNLNEGKAKDWQHTLKLKISKKFLLDCVEIVKILESKRGTWSTIKGFFQWMMLKISDFIVVVKHIV